MTCLNENKCKEGYDVNDKICSLTGNVGPMCEECDYK
jgi:hypothetical protein